MLMRSQKGFTLIETLVGLAIMGLIAIGFLGGLATSSKATLTVDQMDTGRALAQSQMEYIKKLPFLHSYTPDAIPPAYSAYSVTISAVDPSERDSFIQKITITVTTAGKTVAVLQDCKVSR